AVEIFTEEMTDAIRGQGLDIYWRDNFVCPDEEKYKDMLKKVKTGRAFTMAVKLMQIHSECQTDLNRLALNLGLYFQIRDDYCNLMVQEVSNTATDNLFHSACSHIDSVFWGSWIRFPVGTEKCGNTLTLRFFLVIIEGPSNAHLMENGRPEHSIATIFLTKG
ncbi:jg1113, partial [Pararge aegeria aegeria]